MKTIPTFKLVTSNQNKILEYQSIGLPISVENGADLPEIDSEDFSLIAAYKSKMAGDFNIIEDSILIIDDKIYHDIKFRTKEIVANVEKYYNKPVTWVLTLATLIDGQIHLFQNQLSGFIQKPYPGKSVGFGFDSYFYITVDGDSKSLHELKENGLKNQYSPRLMALQKFYDFAKHSSPSDQQYAMEALVEWTGAFQK